MFDVSFSELVLILIVGLIVFGPEKLPEVVRTAGLWFSKLRRSFNHIRSEIEREVGIDELKRDIHNQGIMDSLKEVQNDLRKTQQELGQLPHELQNTIHRNVIDSVHATPTDTHAVDAFPAANELPNDPNATGSAANHHPS